MKAISLLLTIGLALAFCTPAYGDCECSGAVDIDDIVHLVAYIFSGGPEPFGNPDCSGLVDIDDVVYMVEFIFNGGPEPCG